MAARAGRRQGQQLARQRRYRTAQQREQRQNRNRFLSQLAYYPVLRE
jgi:hypothetical protein